MNPEQRRQRLATMIDAELDARPRGTATVLAQACGVHRSSVSAWRRNLQIPDMNIWPNIENFFGWKRGRIAEELEVLTDQTPSKEIAHLRQQVHQLAALVESLAAELHQHADN